MQGGRGAEWSGIPGGKFSLGRLEAGSGYCVGAVVETRMGIREERDEVVYDGKRGRSAPNRGGLGGNGMRDVWVIGEGFFRGVGGLFDVSFPAPLPFLASHNVPRRFIFFEETCTDFILQF